MLYKKISLARIGKASQLTLGPAGKRIFEYARPADIRWQ